MIKKLFVFLICLMISNVIESSSSSSDTPTVSPVTIIVNPNLSNKYQPGECGNQTVTCNNLIDAMESFMKVATLIPGFPNKQYSMYQQLNLLLTDGIYDFDSNSISLFNMNVTMTTLTDNSNSVIFSGGSSSLTSPLFSISNGKVVDTGLTPTYIQINGIQFQINQTLLNVNTVSSFTDFKINNCQFINYNNQLASMVTINQGAPAQLPLENNAIYFTNSTFKLISTGYSTPLMSFKNTIVKISNIDVSNGVLGNFINASYCSVNVEYSNFNGISTSGGLFVGFDSTISVFMDTFIGNNAVSSYAGGSIINMESDTINRYYFEIIFSTFVNNSAAGNGGIVSAINNVQTASETQISYIVNSTFTGSSSYSPYGGVAYLINIPLTIDTSTFGNSTSNIDGSIFYVINSNVIVTNSTFIYGDLPSPSPPTLKLNRGSAVDLDTNHAFYAFESNVTFQSTNMYKVSIDCIQSVVIVNTVDPGIVGPNDVQCTRCLLTVGINQPPYCNPQTTSSSTTSSSSTSSPSTSSTSTTPTTSSTSTTSTTSTTSKTSTTSTTSTTSKTSTTSTTSTTSKTSTNSSTSSPSTSSTSSSSLTSSTSSTTKTASSSSSSSSSSSTTSGTGTSSSGSGGGGHISFVVASSSSTSSTSSTSSVFENSTFGLFVIISIIISLMI
ncbi:hypothetical protein ACTFIZ_009860 [Dictyostelium cf. discoideum]